jgi:hypothetical protein
MGTRAKLSNSKPARGRDASIPIEFRHHRLVTGPDVRRPPWYIESMPVTPYRVTGLKPET